MALDASSQLVKHTLPHTSDCLACSPVGMTKLISLRALQARQKLEVDDFVKLQLLIFHVFKLYLNMCVCIRVCHMYVSTHIGQERELELQTSVREELKSGPPEEPSLQPLIIF